MSTVLEIEETIKPTEHESEIARESSRRLSRYAAHDLKINIATTGQPDETIDLPASVVKLLVRLLSEMANGNAVTLIPIHAELTTQQAADLLGVSRPFLVKQIRQGKLKFRKIGTHRRVLFEDLLLYKRQLEEEGEKALKALTEQAQELDLGY